MGARSGGGGVAKRSGTMNSELQQAIVEQLQAQQFK